MTRFGHTSSLYEMIAPASPSDTDLIRRAFARLDAGDARGAYEDAQSVLQRDRTSAPARMVLGRIAADHANWRAAAALFAEAAERAGDGAGRAAGWAQAARCLIALNRTGDARRAIDRAEAEADETASPITLDTLGAAQTRTGDLARAVRLFERAVAARPDNAAFRMNLGLARQFNGDLEGAGAAYEAALALAPDQARPLSALVSLRRQTAQDNRLKTLTSLFRDDDPDPARQQHLGHALAKTHEDLGDPVASLDWLGRAKAGRRARVGSPIEEDRRLFAASRETRPAHSGGARSEVTDDTPVFIVGLPRSGTTLVDRILSSHAEVVSMGELADFSTEVKRLAETPSPRVLDVETLEAARALDHSELGRRYLAAVADQARRAGEPAGVLRRIDKMPLNVFYAGLIHQALPNARVLCLRRHPVDSALANYRQLFATDFPYYDFALDLADAGRYYAMFDDLVGHWRETLPPDRFTEVAYEDVVADMEGQARRMIAFLGLDWDPACLDFHTNAAPVATASSVQVRSPIYSSSVGRWRRYGEGLKPLLDVLDAAGIAY